MKYKFMVAVVATLFLYFNVEAGVTVTNAVVTEVGIYTVKVVDEFHAPSLVRARQRELTISNWQRPPRTSRPVLVRDSAFDTPSKAVLQRMPPIVLTMGGAHPPFRNFKTGKIQTRDEYQLPSWIGSTYTLCSLDEKWELIPGKWAFEARHEGTKLCEQSFQIVADTN